MNDRGCQHRQTLVEFRRARGLDGRRNTAVLNRAGTIRPRCLVQFLDASFRLDDQVANEDEEKLMEEALDF